MAVSSRRTSAPVVRSLSPSGRFYNSPYSSSPSSSSSSAFASSSSGFTSRSSAFFHRSASPTRVNLVGASPSATSSSVRFSLDRPISPNRSIAVAPRGGVSNNRNHPHQVVRRQSGPGHQKRTCLCSPTTHPGSFRCSLHKGFGNSSSSSSNPHAPYAPNRLNARRSAMTNSLVRIGGVEGADLVKRALAALIRPSSHQQRRRADFRPRPSRLSIMSMAGDDGDS
ncbi:serine-rich protein-like protein [Parasponia andersonii]|uniref:Serine-rich protein-like protein n=1 Tax=Parasponia andersonii TaxID=3476 RepID=A0A2P5BTC2_PARAD|nr:serine-rich protein-like protein [Parasponia andersonii]